MTQKITFADFCDAFKETVKNKHFSERVDLLGARLSVVDEEIFDSLTHLDVGLLLDEKLEVLGVKNPDSSDILVPPLAGEARTMGDFYEKLCRFYGLEPAY